MADDDRYPLLWYTSGTPLVTGQTHCAMARYLGTHAGVHGTGYRRASTAVPLATGKAVHHGLQLILEWVQEYQTTHSGQRLIDIDPAVLAWGASEAADHYARVARARGLILSPGDLDTPAAVETLILEQKTLVEALVWIYGLARLPHMLATHRVLSIEHEEAPVLDCSCSLGDWIGRDVDHAARGCHGIVAQARTDVLWEHVDDGTIVYEEFKTKSSPRKEWEDLWTVSGQLLLNMEAASRRLGQSVNTAFVPVLYKGWRGRDRGAPPTEPKYQHSPLCYGWYDAGNPPLREPNWASRYEWTDAYTGKKHRLGGTFRRTPIWDENYPLPSLRDGASRVENWIRTQIVEDQIGGLITTLGPFPRPVLRVPDAIQALLVEERRWRQIVSWLRENRAWEASHALVPQVVSRSWNCFRYAGTCEFKPICDKDPGWEDMEAMDRFVRRRPHHAPEAAAVEAMGVELPADEDEDDEGDE